MELSRCGTEKDTKYCVNPLRILLLIRTMKYTIQESKEPGWWVVTGTENLSALQLARIMREIGDWVAQHHIDKAL